jgi:transglutaminase-like putative cysteine protease
MKRSPSTTTPPRPTKTSTDVFIERVGVCRDFEDLTITRSHCMNIPARYVTGYIGDIRNRLAAPEISA